MKNVILSLSLFCFSVPLSSFADHHAGHMMKEPTKEERVQMADMHAKMADCLKSEKTMADCHKEAVANCPMAKDGKCPMMMGYHGDHGGPKKKGKKTQ